MMPREAQDRLGGKPGCGEEAASAGCDSSWVLALSRSANSNHTQPRAPKRNKYGHAHGCTPGAALPGTGAWLQGGRKGLWAQHQPP